MSAPRLVATHIRGPLWTIRADGPGAGAPWGHALATTAAHAFASTCGPRPYFWLDTRALGRVTAECGRVGVEVERVGR